MESLIDRLGDAMLVIRFDRHEQTAPAFAPDGGSLPAAREYRFSCYGFGSLTEVVEASDP